MTPGEDRLRALTGALLLVHGAFVVQVLFGAWGADVANEAQWWRRTWLLAGTAAALALFTVPAALLWLNEARPRLSLGLAAAPLGLLPVAIVLGLAGME